MDPEFVAAIAQTAAGQPLNVTRFCREHHLSRDTFYHYLTRFQNEGADGFTHHSSAPHHHPTALPTHVTDAVLQARQGLAVQGLDNGPVSIHWCLRDTGLDPVPSRASIHRILTAHGQIVAQPRKRPKARRRFEFADPNGCWQIDGMEHYLADGQKVCILQILDDHSRLDVGTWAADSENGTDTWRALQQAFAGHGLPVRILSDNGLAFSGKHRGQMVELERHLAALGVSTIASSVRHPQTCGKNERAHQTLQRWLRARPPATTLPQLQGLLEDYRKVYNHRRHQSLNGRTPHQRWTEGVKATPTGHPARSGLTLRPVSATGVVAFSGCSIVLGRAWAGHTGHVFWQGDRVTVMINDAVVRQLVLDRSVRYQRLTHPKPSAMS